MSRKNCSLWAILALMVLFGATSAFAQALLDPTTLTKFVDPLLQPPVRTPSGTLNGQPLYDVHVREANQKMHSQLDSTTVFTFDGATPGATFLVERDHPVYVRYHNDLPQHHMLPVDTTIHVMAGMGYGDKSRFVAHLHGGDVPSWSDGYCDYTIDPGQETTYWYPDSQEAATLWYHDHSCGITRLNAYAGIAGFYIIIDPYERSLNMPAGAQELGIAVQDRQFYANGQLYYPPTWVPEHFGDVALVNGTVWPKLEVDPRKYRIHLLDGCNDRFLSMKLIEADSQGVVPPESLAGPAIFMVGTEQGLVSRTVVLDDPANPASPRLVIGPGDRRDLIIDFAGQQGKYFLMHNNASAPFDGTFPPNPENPLPELFLVHVKDTTVVDMASIPWTPRHQPLYDPAQAAVTRDIIMEEVHDTMGNPMMVMLNGKSFMEPTSEFPELGTSEVWQYVNTTVDMHPMHMHLVNFQVFERQPFNVDEYMMTQQIVYTGPPELPAADELGRRDMVYTPPGYVTRVVTSPFKRLGKYVYHCHILAHEENDMMRPYEVVEPPSVAVVSPNGPDIWNVGQPATITCTHGGGVAVTDSIILTTDGGATWTFLMNEPAADVHNVPMVANTPTGTACVRIIATGLGGLTGTGDCPADFTIARRDAGVSAILAPIEGQIFGSTETITPRACVNNYGTVNEPNVPTVFTLSGYSDTLHLAVNVAPGCLDSSFAGTVLAPGYHTANCATFLPADLAPGNDVATPVSFLVMDSPSGLTPDNGVWLSSSPLLDWADLAGVASANGYRIQVATDAGFSNVVLDQTSTLSEFATSLASADDYYWKVQGVSVLSGPWSPTAHFRLDAVAPDVPVTMAPTPWQQDVMTLPTFEWSVVTFGGKPASAQQTVGTSSLHGTPLSSTMQSGSMFAGKGGRDASAVTYHVEVATDIDFTNLIIDEEPTTTTYTDEDTPLDNEAQYFWRVSASDDAGNEGDWSGPDSFLTAAPPAVQLTSPNGGETWIVGQPATVTCVHSGDVAVTDSIDLTTDGGATWTFLLTEAAADSHNIPSVPNMAADSVCLQITTIGTSGQTDVDDCDNDFTIDLRDAGVLDVLAPTDGQVFASTDTITPVGCVHNFGSEDESDVPVTLTFADYTDEQHPAVPEDTCVDQAFAATTPAPGYYTATFVTSLPQDFVSANDAATVSFLVMDAPEDLAPTGGQWVASSPMLTWDDLDGIADVEGYHIQVATDAGFSNIVVDEMTTDPELATDLNDADAYYWRVRGVNVLSGPWSETAEFRMDHAAPEVPVLLIPTPNEQDVSTLPTFDWTDVSFAGRANLLGPTAPKGAALGRIGGRDNAPVTYHLRVATDANFIHLVIAVDPTMSTYTHNGTPLANEAQYYWRVNATDDAGNIGDWSATDSFVTVEAAPSAFTLLTPANNAMDQPMRGNLIWQSSDDADSFAIYFDTNNPPTTLLRRVAGNVPTTEYSGVGDQTYYWNVVAENGGGRTSAAGGPWHFTTVATGIAENNTTSVDLGMTVSPNPLVTGRAVLRYGLPKAGPATVCVADVTGRTCMMQTLNASRIGSVALDLHELSAGVYLVKLSASGFAYTQRLIVQK